MPTVNEEECKEAGLDLKEVQSIANRLERAGRDAQRLGLHIFGGSGSGSLRFDTSEGPLVVADFVGGNWDGGDGAAMPDERGLVRGEF